MQDGYLVANTRFAIQPTPPSATRWTKALEAGVLQLSEPPACGAWWQQLSGGFEPTAEQSSKNCRLSLTQTWRVSVGGALYKSYPTLNDALVAIGAIRGWRVRARCGGKSRPEGLLVMWAGFDISQLPRPFQLSALGATDWKLESD